MTPLLIATANGHLEVVRALLTAEANPNQADEVGGSNFFFSGRCMQAGCTGQGCSVVEALDHTLHPTLDDRGSADTKDESAPRLLKHAHQCLLPRQETPLIVFVPGEAVTCSTQSACMTCFFTGRLQSSLCGCGNGPHSPR